VRIVSISDWFSDSTRERRSCPWVVGVGFIACMLICAPKLRANEDSFSFATCSCCSRFFTDLFASARAVSLDASFSCS
jgi:lipoprotein